MTTVWYDRKEAAERLGVKPGSLKSVAGFKAIETQLGGKTGIGGARPKLYLRSAVEKLRAARTTAPKKSHKKKVAAKKRRRPETPNQRKVKKANEALKKPNARHHDESVDKLFAKFVVEIKKIDPTISVVRVELARKSIEVLGGE